MTETWSQRRCDLTPWSGEVFSGEVFFGEVFFAAELGCIGIEAATLRAAAPAAHAPGVRPWGPTRRGTAGGHVKTCPLAPSFALVALCAGVTATDCVVPPERLCVDQCPRHPRLILRELDGLECTIWNAQGWLPEAPVATGRKAET